MRTVMVDGTSPGRLRRRNLRVGMVLALLLGGLYALAICGVVVLN
jgi:hypothetical protein